jgi:hypothetical protein
LVGVHKEVILASKSYASHATLSETGASLPLVNAMIASYQAAIAAGYGDKPKSAMLKMTKKVLDVEFRKKAGSAAVTAAPWQLCAERSSCFLLRSVTRGQTVEPALHISPYDG